jgi:hypothetical protein
MALIKRLVKGSPLTFAEGDANLDYLESLSTTLNAWTGSNTSQFAGTASFVSLKGLGITVNGLEITSSVRTVNGTSPVNGNIAVSIAATYTGFSSSLSGAPSLQASSSGDITASFSGGTLWIVTGETNPARTGSNGETFIFASGSVGQWIQVPNYSQNAADARYLRLSGGAMTGDIDMGTKDATNAGTWKGTADTASYISPSIASASIASYNGFGTLTQELKPNASVGVLGTSTTYPAGTNIEQILRAMLISYIPPTVSALSLKYNSSNISLVDREVGNELSSGGNGFNTASFTATADNPNNRFAYSASFTASGADTGNFSYYFGNNVLGSTNNLGLGGNISTINRNTNGTVTFTVRATRPDNSAIISTSTTVNFRWKNYLCASNKPFPTNNATAQDILNNDVVDSVLDTDRAWSADCDDNNNLAGYYTYIIYPSSYGLLTDIKQNGSQAVLGAFIQPGNTGPVVGPNFDKSFTLSNTYGKSNTYYIYRSNSPKAFADGVILTIS